MVEQSTEERITHLEHEVVALKQMLAEHRSFDEIRADIRSLRRTVTEFSEREQGHERYVQARFGVVDYDLKSINSELKETRTEQRLIIARLDTIEEEQTKLVEIGVNHTKGLNGLSETQQQLIAGQQQIIEMLLGKSRHND
jgi:chromosome segregation ATPase